MTTYVTTMLDGKLQRSDICLDLKRKEKLIKEHMKYLFMNIFLVHSAL